VPVRQAVGDLVVPEVVADAARDVRGKAVREPYGEREQRDAGQRQREPARDRTFGCGRLGQATGTLGKAPRQPWENRFALDAFTGDARLARGGEIRRALTLALALALCVAALTAIVAVVSGDFDDTDGRTILSSLGFAFFSATAASGASLRYRASGEVRALGAATTVLSVVGFVLLLVALWTDADDPLWRWFGAVGVTAVAGSHASLVIAALRPSDSPTVRTLAMASIALGCVDSFLGVLAISGAVDTIPDSFAQLVAVLVILLLLTTVLPPILRRLPGAAEPSSRSTPSPPARTDRPSAQPFAAEVLAAADRIDALNADPGNRAPDIQRECERLRELARGQSR